MKTNVTDFLDAQGISYTIKKHAEPALTCETAAAQRNVRVSQIVKCMVGRDDKAALYVMLLPGHKTLKIKKVRKYVGGKPIKLADPTLLASELGLTVGAISPTDFIGKARIIMDPTVLEEEFVDISSSDPMAGVELTSRDLQAVTQAEVHDIISANS
jgi:Cys-tRNA(Pro) deacylase